MGETGNLGKIIGRRCLISACVHLFSLPLLLRAVQWALSRLLCFPPPAPSARMEQGRLGRALPALNKQQGEGDSFSVLSPISATQQADLSVLPACLPSDVSAMVPAAPQPVTRAQPSLPGWAAKGWAVPGTKPALGCWCWPVPGPAAAQRRVCELCCTVLAPDSPGQEHRETALGSRKSEGPRRGPSKHPGDGRSPSTVE